MQRRDFLKTAGVGAAAAGLALPVRAETPMIKWRLASSFPKSLDTIFGGAEVMAKRVAELTDGRFEIRVFAGGEIVPPFGVLDAVQQNTVECGHTASYYYFGKNKALALETTLPFGLNTRQLTAWTYFGGGMDLLRAMFAEYNIINFPGGSTGCPDGRLVPQGDQVTEGHRGAQDPHPRIRGGDLLAHGCGAPVAAGG